MARATVFIVDDDPSVRRALSRLLGSEGFDVQSFEDAWSFLRFERTASGPQCLVLDIQMPVLGGVELHRRLLEAKRALPTIFVTAYPRRDLEQLSSAENVVDILYKPFDADELLSAIQRAVT